MKIFSKNEKIDIIMKKYNINLSNVSAEIIDIIYDLFEHDVVKDIDDKYFDAKYSYIMYYYGFYYESKKNFSEAFLWFVISAKFDNTKAMNKLASYNEKGKGIEKNIMNAIKLYEKSASMGNSNAMVHLGHYYLLGNDIKKDIAKAVSLYTTSVDKNNSYAMIHLGYCYQNGIGVDKNITKAITLYNKSKYIDKAMTNIANEKLKEIANNYFFEIKYVEENSVNHSLQT